MYSCIMSQLTTNWILLNKSFRVADPISEVMKPLTSGNKLNWKKSEHQIKKTNFKK